MKLVNKECTYENEDTAEDNGSENSPEKCFVIVLFFYLEIFQDKKYDKDIINRKSVFSQVCGKIFDSTFCSAIVILIYEKAEEGRDHYPEDGLIEC